MSAIGATLAAFRAIVSSLRSSSVPYFEFRLYSCITEGIRATEACMETRHIVSAACTAWSLHGGAPQSECSMHCMEPAWRCSTECVQHALAWGHGGTGRLRHANTEA
eukprot:364437-Chlamydomonas_euryale.AAC.7